jgi:PadR family transcriptional regulator, regulatory protein AphA
MDLSPTAYVILGMLRHEPRSGYEIKKVVDHSTRFFWAASYGQIYPELRKLEKAGLVEGESKPTGGRRRTVYRLTDAGREELQRWLAEPPEVFELRDESVLKLFFASEASPERAIEILAARKHYHEAKIAELRAIEPYARMGADSDPYPHLVLRHGIEFSEAVIATCERAQAELRKAGSKRSQRRAA